MVPILVASMQCACACIAALRDAHCKWSDWPKHCSAAIAVRYDCFYQRRVPTTVVQWVAELANGTNGAAQRLLKPQLACLLLVPYRPLAQPTWSQSHHTRLEEYEGVWQRVAVGPSTAACLIRSLP